MEMTGKDFSAYTYGEAQTAGGQLIHFSCRSEDLEEIKKVFQDKLRNVSFPETHRVMLEHGMYGRYTRYEIIQHKYAGWNHESGAGGYIEVLEVKNPTDGRGSIVIYDYRDDLGAVFTEWETLESAIEGERRFWGQSDRTQESWEKLGCKRFVRCGELDPWFYAVGNQELVGDYVFPEYLQDDPVYTFGRKFIVQGADDFLEVKTCFGARFISGERESFSGHRSPWAQRIVYWSDGSSTVMDCGKESAVKPLERDEAWIAEASRQFTRLLSGNKERFLIKLLDGTQFIGRVIPDKGRSVFRRAGRYFAKVQVEGEAKVREGWVDFVPSEKEPDVLEYIKAKLSEKGKEIVSIAINPEKQHGRKWAGVFL
jgi:hypothetical protein